MPASRVRPTVLAAAAGLDAALLLVFVLIGRANHNETLLGTLGTWWPFLTGLVVGWLVMRAWRHPLTIVWTGLGVWLITVAVAMLLRIVTGDGAPLSFAIVTLIVVGVFLIGWRGIAALARRVRR
jgi:hypothetical protein